MENIRVFGNKPKKSESILKGKYIIRYSVGNECWEILREVSRQNLVYETIIPNAGYHEKFAFELLSLLNSQGSEHSEFGGETSSE